MGFDALGFVAAQGIVLQSARHAAVATLTEAIVGGRIRGSWWGHPRGREIYRVLQEVYGSPDVVATRLVDGKVTLVHRRLWPSLAALGRAGQVHPDRLARVTEEHTASGRHRRLVVPFPEWLPTDLRTPRADQALRSLGPRLAAVVVGARR
jgi:hypothetical protein